MKKVMSEYCNILYIYNYEAYTYDSSSLTQTSFSIFECAMCVTCEYALLRMVFKISF